jgi:hypothetical protein
MKFDDTFKVDLGALAGANKFAGGLVAQKDGPVYTRVLLDAAVPPTLTNPLQISGAPLWEMFKLDDVTNPTAATKVETPPAGGVLYPFTIDGKTYVADAALQQGKSWLVDISVDPPARTLELPGWGYYGLRLR